ncbi:MAG: efflux RND transporter periplasmic adaptor subunit [Sphingobium sp.]|nr:efflux RND transporter periplasmic adaptor subunit [Sphingobium sp.]
MNYESSFDKNAVLGTDELDAETIRKRRRLILSLLVVIAVIVVAFVAWRMMGGKKEQNQGPSQVPLVTVAVPGQQAVTKTANATGSLDARVDMPVGVLGEGGRVLRVLVEPGAWVQKGQILVVIERTVQAQQINSSAAQVEVARANAKLAENNLERAKALVGQGFVSKADIDQKTAARDAAVAQQHVAEAQLAQLRASVGRLDIRAPESGLVLTRNVEPGQVVSPGSGTLFRVAKNGEMEMLAQLAENELAALRPGVKAIVTPVGTDAKFIGTVWQVSPVIDPQSRLGIARISLPYNVALRPGGFANATIDIADMRASVLPESAVLSDQKGSYVYIVNDKNKVERRNVVTGTVTPNGLAINSGLQGNEKVVLFAGGFLNAGETVKVNVAKPGTTRR